MMLTNIYDDDERLNIIVFFVDEERYHLNSTHRIDRGSAKVELRGETENGCGESGEATTTLAEAQWSRENLGLNFDVGKC